MGAISGGQTLIRESTSRGDVRFNDESGNTRVHLCGSTQVVNSVACESPAGICGGLSARQAFKVAAGQLLPYKITTVDGSKENILINTNSLAHRRGVDKEKLLVSFQQKDFNMEAFLEDHSLLSDLCARAYSSKERYESEVGAFRGHNVCVAISEDGILGEGGSGRITRVASLTISDFSSKSSTTCSMSSLDDQLAIKTALHEEKEQDRVCLENEALILGYLHEGAREKEGIVNTPFMVRSGATIGKSEKKYGLLEERYDGDLCHIKVESKHWEPMIFQLLMGLKAVHDKGVLHGDIKSGNVLVRDLDSLRGTPKFHLSDFGGAQLVERQRQIFKAAVDEVKKGDAYSGFKAAILRGSHTEDFYPDLGAEMKAIDDDNFEDWVKARKAGDLYAIAITIEQKLPSRTHDCKEHALLQEIKKVIRRMKGECWEEDLLSTAKDALLAFREVFSTCRTGF